MKDNREELMKSLMQKVEQEQETYRLALLAMPQEEMLAHAYAYAVREDIVLKLSYMNLTTSAIKRLLKYPHPVEEIFYLWEDYESIYMEVLAKMIKQSAKA